MQPFFMSIENEVMKNDLLYNPDYLLHDLTLISHEYTYIKVAKHSYSNSSFLDMRIEGATGESWQVNMPLLNKIRVEEKKNDVQVNYLFHISFVGSTLISRCLNVESKVFSLREPWILRKLGDTKRGLIHTGNFDLNLWQDLVENCVSLLGKTYCNSESVLIKPTNVANNLIEDIFSRSCHAKGLFLYTDLEQFLLTNLNKSLETKNKMPLLAKILYREARAEKWLEKLDFGRLSHIEACILIWYFHLDQYIHFPVNIKSKLFLTNIETFLDNPTDSLNQFNQFLGLKLNELDINTILNSEVLNKNAKAPKEAFNSKIREERYKAIMEQFSDEIQEAKCYLNHIAGFDLEQSILKELNTDNIHK